MPQTDKYCCCCSLRTGSFIIAGLGLYGSIFIFVSTFISGNDTTPNKPYMTPFYDDFIGPKKLLNIITIVLTVFTFVEIILHLMLLWGIYKNKRLWMLPWLITDAAGILIIALYNIVDIVLGGNLIIFFVLSLYAGLQTYLWLCIFLYYQQIYRPENFNVKCGDEDFGFITQDLFESNIDTKSFQKVSTREN